MAKPLMDLLMRAESSHQYLELVDDEFVWICDKWFDRLYGKNYDWDDLFHVRLYRSKVEGSTPIRFDEEMDVNYLGERNEIMLGEMGREYITVGLGLTVVMRDHNVEPFKPYYLTITKQDK